MLPETKILHLADNFGQIDVLLALYHPLIKIESFIEDEEKRGVASTNYIVNIRKIKYLQKLSDAKIDFDTVIISSSNITIENLESLKTAKTVILMNSFELENEIISYGFSVENKEKTILVLKK